MWIMEIKMYMGTTREPRSESSKKYAMYKCAKQNWKLRKLFSKTVRDFLEQFMSNCLQVIKFTKFACCWRDACEQLDGGYPDTAGGTGVKTFTWWTETLGWGGVQWVYDSWMESGRNPVELHAEWMVEAHQTTIKDKQNAGEDGWIITILPNYMKNESLWNALLKEFGTFRITDNIPKRVSKAWVVRGELIVMGIIG